MRTITIYEPGDVVRIKDDWRDWRKGEEAEVCAAFFERGGFSGSQMVRLVNENEHDFNTLYAYQVEEVPA